MLISRSTAAFVLILLFCCHSTADAQLNWRYEGTFRLQGTVTWTSLGCVYTRVLEGRSFNGGGPVGMILLPSVFIGPEATFIFTVTDTFVSGPKEWEDHCRQSSGLRGHVGETFPDILVNGLSVSGQMQHASSSSAVVSAMSFNGALTPDLMRITGDVSATQTFWFDGVMTGQFQFDLTSAPALEVTETHLPDAEVGSFYSAPELLQAQGGIPPYIWSVAPGSPLPPGLVLSHSNSRGTLGGILDATAEEDSRYDPLLRRFLFRVEVSDAYGHTAQSEIALEVECGDERDDLIEEYQLYGVFDESKQELFVPRCVEITSTGRTQFYSFQELNVSNTSFPGMALLKNSLLTGEGVPLVFKSVGLDGIVANYGSIPVHAPPCPAPGLPSCVVNSGYRTPEQQADVSPAYPNGRHIFGDAVDLPNPDRNSPLEVKKATYDRLVNAALSAGADWVENVAAKIDCAPSVMNCVHADYRNTKAKYAK